MSSTSDHCISSLVPGLSAWTSGIENKVYIDWNYIIKTVLCQEKKWLWNLKNIHSNKFGVECSHNKFHQPLGTVSFRKLFPVWLSKAFHRYRRPYEKWRPGGSAKAGWIVRFPRPPASADMTYTVTPEGFSEIKHRLLLDSGVTRSFFANYWAKPGRICANRQLAIRYWRFNLTPDRSGPISTTRQRPAEPDCRNPPVLLAPGRHHINGRPDRGSLYRSMHLLGQQWGHRRLTEFAKISQLPNTGKSPCPRLPPVPWSKMTPHSIP